MGILLPKNSVTIYRGTSKTLQLTVSDDTEIAVDITGASIYFTAKREARDIDPVIQKNTQSSSEIELTLPRSGIARIYLNPADTLRLEPGLYVFDVLVILASGKRYLVVEPTTLEILVGVSVIP